MKDKPKLSIIITHYKTPDKLRMCLDSIFGKLKNVSFEVIVTDGETEREMADPIIKDYPQITFLEHKDNVGFSGLVNPAIKASVGEFIFVINADIFLEKDEDMVSLIEHLEKDSKVGVIGPKLFNIDGSIQQSYFREYNIFIILAKRTAFGKMKIAQKIVAKFNYDDKKANFKDFLEVDWLMGSALLMKRERFEEIGGKLDDRFFMYFEDVDLCKRFREKGFKVIYKPSVQFTHHHARGSHYAGGFLDIFKSKLTRIHIASYLKFLWKWKVLVLFDKNRFFKK